MQNMADVFKKYLLEIRVKDAFEVTEILFEIEDLELHLLNATLYSCQKYSSIYEVRVSDVLWYSCQYMLSESMKLYAEFLLWCEERNLFDSASRPSASLVEHVKWRWNQCEMEPM